MLGVAFAVTVPVVALVRRIWPRKCMAFHDVYGLAFAGYLHGTMVIPILVLALVHYVVCVLFAGTRAGQAAVWSSALAMLVVVQLYGERFSFTAVGLPDLDNVYPGMMRWSLHFNLVGWCNRGSDCPRHCITECV